MFTGIIEETGTIESMKKAGHSMALTIKCSKILEDVHLGDSIAVNGICLTVTDFTKINSQWMLCLKQSKLRH